MTQRVRIDCQCPTDGIDHDAGKCNRPASLVVLRDGKLLKLCHGCAFMTDTLIDDLDDEYSGYLAGRVPDPRD
jgi:hypothetical protein